MKRENATRTTFGYFKAMAGITALALGLAACAAGVEDAGPDGEVSGAVALADPQVDEVSMGTDCASVSAWVAAHAESLPTRYEDLSRLPSPYRRAIFDALPAAARSSLWQQHFQAYLAAHPGLNREQAAFVREAQGMMSPEIFVNGDGAAPNLKLAALIEALEPRATALFPDDELHGLVASLGPTDTAESVAGPGTSALPTCECNLIDDWCWNRGPDYYCGQTACEYRSTGCGWFLGKSCNGGCTR